MSNYSIPRPVWTAGDPATGTLRAKARLGYLLDRLAAMLSARRQRNDLAGLDDRTLHDIGVSRADVEREASRRFWDIDV